MCRIAELQWEGLAEPIARDNAAGAEWGRVMKIIPDDESIRILVIS
jgi:hypothetical protein